MSGRDWIDPMDGGALHGAMGMPPQAAGVIVGELIALLDGLPWVADLSQPALAACRALSTVDLCSADIGKRVVLMYEQGDASRPIVMGLLRDPVTRPQEVVPPGQVELCADGRRMVVNAREQLVLRCGKASITLTQAGKVLIEGAYVLSRASGVHRIKGGSVQLN